MKVSQEELSRLIGQRDTHAPTAEELAALVDQTLPPERREALLNHLERNAESARAVAIALEPDSASPGGAQPRWLAAAAAAVAAVALASFLLLGGEPPQDTLRAAQTELTPSPGAVVQDATALFSWPLPADRALRRVRLMNASAETLWLSDLTSPPLDLPQQFAAGEDNTYLWQLEDASGAVVAGPQWFQIP
ncbi:MAG: hypothetical protein AAF358_25875 [Pseudomonadota bacterium]